MEVDFSNDIYWQNFRTNLYNFISYKSKIENCSEAREKEKIAEELNISEKSVNNWLNEKKPSTPDTINILKLSKLMYSSVEELLISNINFEERFSKKSCLGDNSVKDCNISFSRRALKKIKLSKNTAYKISQINKEIVWRANFSQTMKMLNFNEETVKELTIRYSSQTHRKEFPLWESKELLIVTFSTLLNYVSLKETYMMEILTQLSDILNLLKDWKDRKDRSDVIKKLNKYEVVNEDAYIDFKDSINDDEKLKNELDAVEKSVSKIITKIFKEFILDEFRNFPSGKSEKKSTSN